MTIWASATGLTGAPGSYTYNWYSGYNQPGQLLSSTFGDSTYYISSVETEDSIYCVVTDQFGHSCTSPAVWVVYDFPATTAAQAYYDTVYVGGNMQQYIAITSYTQIFVNLYNPGGSQNTTNYTTDNYSYANFFINNATLADSGAYTLNISQPGPCSFNPPVTIYVTVLSAHSGSAGPDQTACLNTMVQMAATGTGTWSALSSNPYWVDIHDSTSPTTFIGQFWTPGLYYFVWHSGGAADTMAVNVGSTVLYVNETVSQNPVCVGAVDTFRALGVSGADTISPYYSWYSGEWSPTTLLASGLYDTIYTASFASPGMDSIWSVVQCTSASCASQPVYAIGSQYPTVISCATVDTVWPGDADDNKLVDNRDLLTIGLGYDSIGPVRTVQGNVWQGDLATDWAQDFTVFLPTVNYVHADCDGNGTINADDTAAIALNWGDTHAKANNMPAPWVNGLPGIGLSITQDTLMNNDTMTVQIILGSSATPVNNIYGLAFTFNYDPLVIDSNYSVFSFIPSWLGTSANSININRNVTVTGQVKASITGINHIARSGNGQIATFRGVVTTDNINGKTFSYYHNLIYISDVTAIDQHGNPVPLNEGIDSNYVGYTPNGIKPLSAPSLVTVYPNPAATQVKISADADITEISITDMLGETVQTMNVNSKKAEVLNISQLTSGVYIVHVSSAGGSATAKLIVSR